MIALRHIATLSKDIASPLAMQSLKRVFSYTVLGKQSNGEDKESNDKTEETAAYNDLEDMDDDEDVAATVAI